MEAERNFPEIAFCKYRYSDFHLFEHGYSLIKENIDNKKVVEICCGTGDLSGQLALTYPNIEVIGIDFSEDSIKEARDKYANIKNLQFIIGDVFNMDHIINESIDIVFGQAALHHLQNNIDCISREIARILKPGGKCIFIFEPVGNNPFISAIRSAINSRAKLIDEANLYDNAFQIFGKNFSNYEVYYFNFLGYLSKVLPKSKLSLIISNVIYKLDLLLFKIIPNIKKYSANANLCYWK
jgi:ubiquinone/menaquinone biosynthesis C-methylase UbiE